MSSRLTPGKVAVILSSLRQKGFAEEAEQLEQHIEAVSAEDGVLQSLQSMTEAMVRSSVAESATARILETWKPVVEGSTAALDRLAKVEERRIALEEREFEKSKLLLGLQFDKVIWPIITAVTGIMSAAAAWFFGGGSPTP